jgi:hypothetical protein
MGVTMTLTDLRRLAQAATINGPDATIFVRPQTILALLDVIDDDAVLLRSIIYRLNGATDVVSKAITKDCNAALAALEGK